MKNIFLLLLFTTFCFSQNPIRSEAGFLAGSSVNDMNSKAISEFRSTTKGALFPRMTTTERNAISSPPTSLLIFNLTTNRYEYHNGTSWVQILPDFGYTAENVANKATGFGTINNTLYPTVQAVSTYVSSFGFGTVTSVTSANGNATVTNTTTTPQITIVSAPKLETARTIGTITGDATSPGSSFDGTANNSNALTLATVNSNVGTFGSATQSAVHTVNAKGLTTAISNVTITPAVGSITGLGAGVSSALATATGTAGAFVVNGGSLGTPGSGTATNLTGLPLTTGVTGVLPIANGGTNLTALGTALQSIRVNSGATALEYYTPTSGVTSVSGTTNRITSTGGTTPVIDISATFEALLGKVANRIDQNNASTTSAQLASVISDETGTGTLVFNISPRFTTNAGFTSSTVLSGPTDGSLLVQNNAMTGGGAILLGGVTSADPAIRRVANNKVGITSANNNANIILQTGTVQYNYTAKTANYTAATNDYYIDCTSGTFTVTLPTAVGCTGQAYVINNSGTGTITVATTSSQTFDGGATTRILSTQNSNIKVFSNGANWLIESIK